MTNFSSITLLRLVCCWEVFFLHWFARAGMRDYMWVWSGAVPCFLLVSAFIYGLRPAERQVWGVRFIGKRWKSLSGTYYPFIAAVFAWYAFSDTSNIWSYVLSFICELSYATALAEPLPGCGHLWFIQTLALCYLLLAVVCGSERLRKLFVSRRISVVLIVLTLVSGGGKTG